MGLVLLAVMVVAGVTGVVLAVHLSGGSAPARLDGAEAARRRFAVDFPDLEPGRIHVTATGDAALLALGDGRAGIVRAVGGKFLTRVVAGPDLAGEPQAEGATVRLRLRDVTWPGGDFTFDGADEAGAAARLLAALRRPD